LRRPCKNVTRIVTGLRRFRGLTWLKEIDRFVIASQRSRERAPDDRPAKQSSLTGAKLDCFVAALLAMTAWHKDVDARDKPGHDDDFLDVRN
jgi:hypothetical protein